MMFVSSTSTRQVPLEELELLITELQSSLPDGFVFYLFMVFWGFFLLVLFFMGRDGFTLLNLCFFLFHLAIVLAVLRFTTSLYSSIFLKRLIFH